ncbi:MAG: UpxY family transcription antiterminator [Bacteroidales bacterium]|nr:MAG: UpxY family transcription antiterminator [Bacteroidales bacterium]
MALEKKIDARWYAAYTKPRNEKKVLERLEEAGIESYLPLQRRLKQWSDRKKMVEEPLFRSYIFVRITQKDYYNVLNTLGIVRYITFEGKAVPIPDNQINLIKNLLEQNVEVEAVEETLEPGAKVEVKFGSLIGLKGELVEHKGKQKVVVKIEHISHSLLVTLPAQYVTKAIE